MLADKAWEQTPEQNLDPLDHWARQPPYPPRQLSRREAEGRSAVEQPLQSTQILLRLLTQAGTLLQILLPLFHENDPKISLILDKKELHKNQWITGMCHNIKKNTCLYLKEMIIFLFFYFFIFLLHNKNKAHSRCIFLHKLYHHQQNTPQ